MAHLAQLYVFVSLWSFGFCLNVLRFPKNNVSESSTTMRIFGGIPAKDGQFPYMIFTLYHSRPQPSSCSASLIAEDKVLLAAHCFEDDAQPTPGNLIAVAGKADLKEYMTYRRQIDFSRHVDERALNLQERRGVKVKISPNYVGGSVLRNDVAVVTVDRPFQLNSNVALIPLAEGTITRRTTCTIQGWGLAQEDRRSYRLMFVSTAHALPVDKCQYKEKNSPFFCLAKTHSGICQGDSGSPAVCDRLVYGVASHVLIDSNDASCGDDLLEVFASLNEESDWLLPLLSNTSTMSPSGNNKPVNINGRAAISPTISLLSLVATLAITLLL